MHSYTELYYKHGSLYTCGETKLLELFNILFALRSRESDESSETDDGHQYCDSWSPPPGPIRSNPEPDVCVRVGVCVCTYVPIGVFNQWNFYRLLCSRDFQRMNVTYFSYMRSSQHTLQPWLVEMRRMSCHPAIHLLLQ